MIKWVLYNRDSDIDYVVDEKMILYFDYIIQIIFILLLSYSSTKESIRSANYSVDIYVPVYPSYISLWKNCPPLISHWAQIDNIVTYKLYQSPNSQIITISPGISMDIWQTVALLRWRHQMETFKRYRPFVRGIHRSTWISNGKASEAQLWCFLWSAPE